MALARNLLIKQKLTLIIMSISGTVLLVSSLGFVIHDLFSFRAGMVREASRLAEFIGTSTAEALAANELEAADELFSILPDGKQLVSSCLYSREGNLIAGYVRQGARGGGCPEAHFETGHRFEKDRILLSQDVYSGGVLAGRVYVQLDMHELRARLERYAVICLVLLLSCILIAFILSKRLQRPISEPIVRLSNAARIISEKKDYSIRVKKEGNDELGMLTDGFNEMLSQIQTREEALRQTHKDLEKRVEQRTQLLQREADSRAAAEVALSEKEEEFRQAQKMEAVGRLAGGVAHDFNNLLTAISGYSELILANLKEGDPIRAQVQEIQKAGNRAASLTRQLLAFSRRQVLAPKVLNLNDLVADMEKMLRRLIGEDLELVTVLDHSIGPIKADPGQIEQVILNLTVNARDAMPDGGKLIIETRSIQLDAAAAGARGWAPGAYVMLAVSDTGCGMDAETQSRIFEPFYTTKPQGTGLGLSTVYGVITQSGGQVSVYSEPGVGTSFKVHLPQVHESVRTEAMEKVENKNLTGWETILLVEDEELVRDLARTILRSRGYRVLTAAHGGEALLLCESYSGPIHLMISDVVMPHLDGPDLVKRSSPLRPKMKVLLMSGYTDAAVVHQGGVGTETPFIPKPFSPVDLALKVRQTLDRQTLP